MNKIDFMRFFDVKDLAKKDEVEYKSRSKLIIMPIDDFLNMALPIQVVDQEKMRSMDELSTEILETKTKIKNIPLLLAHVNPEDPLTAKIVGHEGRHRAMMLKNLGCQYMPVMLTTSNIRFSEQDYPDKFDYKKVWPEKLVSENGDIEIDFPVSRGQATERMFLRFAAQAQKSEPSLTP